MTLYELSFTYKKSEQALEERIRALTALRPAELCDEQRALDLRISDLRRLLYQTRELTVLTRRYYEEGYHKNESYTL